MVSALSNCAMIRRLAWAHNRLKTHLFCGRQQGLFGLKTVLDHQATSSPLPQGRTYMFRARPRAHWMRTGELLLISVSVIGLVYFLFFFSHIEKAWGGVALPCRRSTCSAIPFALGFDLTFQWLARLMAVRGSSPRARAWR